MLFISGLAATVGGGFVYFTSLISGKIMISKLPYREINRHDEPERFRYWQNVSGGVLAVGVMLLLGNALI